MCEGYCNREEDQDSYRDLDEFLCEYVDGTMDPSVRCAFEEYIRRTPRLAEHIEELRSTRRILCRYGSQLHAPAGLQSRLRQRLGSEVLRPQVSFGMVSRLHRMAALSSFLLITVFVALLAGEVRLVEPAPTASQEGFFSRPVQGVVRSGFGYVSHRMPVLAYGRSPMFAPPPPDTSGYAAPDLQRIDVAP